MIGTSLGHYRITGELGRGGMGIVYRAEDTKLERTVAIKVLPPNALTNEEDRTRFYREAKAAAQLNHPNIAAIHQIDEAVPDGSPPGTAPSPFIAMEFIDGQPLDERIRERPLPLEEAVSMSKAVASALQAAHEKNIVHRDIKSANVMLTAKGEPKVLDFGLAKTTHSTMLTRMGSTLGTVAYMSPEQARGEEVDARSDLWSLGIVMYEMVTGKVPFSTEYEQAAVYSILNEDPEPLTALRSGVPMELERIVFKLLAKDRGHRYQTAMDLRADLEALDLRRPSGQTTRSTITLSAPPATTPLLSRRTAIGSAVLIGLVLVLSGWWLGQRFASPDAGPEIAHFASVLLPDMNNISHPTISPDGRYMAFTTDRSVLWLYDFSNGNLSNLDAGGDIRLSAFSPDSRRLAYEARGSNIHMVTIPDGVPSLLVEDAVLPEWIDNEWLLISDTNETGLDRFHRLTRVRESVYSTADVDLAVSHADVLPGGKKALVTVLSSPRSVALMDLETGSLTILIDDAFAPRYLISGHIVFTRGAGGDTSYEGEVQAQPFDLGGERMLGQSIRVMGSRGYWEYGVSAQGDLATSVPLDSEVQQVERDLYLYDFTTGVKEDTGIDLPLSSEFVQLTKDEEWLMFVDQETEQIMFGRVADRRFSPIPNVQPPIMNAWLADDDQSVYYTSGQVGSGLKVYRQAIDGSGTPELIDFGLNRHELLFSVRGDHQFLVLAFGSIGAPGALTYINTETGDQQVISTRSITSAMLSPDGNWVVWYAEESGSNMEVWISGVNGEGPWLITEDWGYPIWNADGTGLYLYNDNQTVFTEITMDRVVRAEGTMQDVLQFEGNTWYYLRSGSNVLALLDRANTRVQATTSMEVVLSWSARLEQLAPVD